MDGTDPRRILNLADRPSDSPYVERVWSSVAGGGPMTSVACTHRELVVSEERGGVRVDLRGPETVPTPVEVPAGHTAFGIVLTHGTSMPHLPSTGLVDGSVQLRVSSRGFVLAGEEWEVPHPDAAEQFVARLVRAGMLVRDPLVDDVLAGATARVGARTVERRVRAATGLSRGTVRQIDRAREAVTLLAADVAPLDVVAHLGYHDHPHLARSLTRFIGHTASWLRAPDAALSLLYKDDDRARL
ncbi:AraC family transcriptional regulator [Pseudonocardia endophytica]|uniref:AraC family transcriptional regulator n=1 Tax=Pseudonocardia endophytica TaxID=401976 RepID=UPI001FB359D5|nr:AraC family transcriptional regulator [Pseudonocardia endophytica]